MGWRMSRRACSKLDADKHLPLPALSPTFVALVNLPITSISKVARYMVIVFAPAAEDIAITNGICLLERFPETTKRGDSMQRALRDDGGGGRYTSRRARLSSPITSIAMTSWNERRPVAPAHLASLPITNLKLSVRAM
ncbi:hypothetical protein FIBSPDRAFT_1037852 [Athelia psychrophila]|uniref:Uncharacterized protein n=1 Tax=Athelia psychrophila TaxID=1759441 RepID=A0A166TRG1_9AGAM|nr:hypothetical protein FIBSPDRAFT_1037852 [Fibularhizoctonia sp. CBS 109695]